jgi:hypothetical protein
MIARVMIAAVLFSMFGQSAPVPAVHPSPRLAAVAFAIQNGYNLPRTNMVVANEVTYGGTSDVPRLRTDRRTTLPVEETMRDAQALAKLLGPEVKTGWARELLDCPRNSNLCKLKTSVSVLVVEELANNETGVLMKFYAPDQPIYMALVETQKQSSGWTAKEFSVRPR